MMDAIIPIGAPGAPQSASRFQIRAALLGADLLDQVDALIAGPDAPAIVKLTWKEAPDITRAGQCMAFIADALAWTDAQLDQFFITAAEISA
jgi:hypothetical protein